MRKTHHTIEVFVLHLGKWLASVRHLHTDEKGKPCNGELSASTTPTGRTVLFCLNCNMRSYYKTERIKCKTSNGIPPWE